MLQGETVTVLTYSEGENDEMGEPVKQWTAQTVSNVLVRPLSGSDEAEEERPDGVRATYTLAFPKTASDITPTLRGARIALTDRGMDNDPDKAFRVSGSPDITRPCPTAWNATVTIGYVYG